MSNNKRRRLIPPAWGPCSIPGPPKPSSSYTAQYIKSWQPDSHNRDVDHPEPSPVQASVSNAAWVAAQPDGPPVPFAPIRCLWPSPPVLDFLASQIDAIEDRNLEPLLQLFEQHIQPSALSNSGAATDVVLAARVHSCSVAAPAPLAFPVPAAPTASSPLGSPLVMPLQEPRLLCGHQGDHVEAHAGLLPHWEKLGLEPAGSPKTLQYTVLVPDDLAPMARTFFRDVGAAYASLGAGFHMPAATCTMLRRVSGIAPIPRTSPTASSVPVGSSRGGSAPPSAVQPVVHPVTGAVTNHLQGFYPGTNEPLIQLLPQQPTTPQLPESGGAPVEQAGPPRPGHPLAAAGDAVGGVRAALAAAGASPPNSRAATPAPGSVAGAVTCAAPLAGVSGTAGDSWWLNMRYTLDMLQRSLVANRPHLGYSDGRSLGPEAEANAAYVVYVVPPTNSAADALRCLLEAAARLAPITTVGAATVSAAAAAINMQAASTGGAAGRDDVVRDATAAVAGVGGGLHEGAGHSSAALQSQHAARGLAPGLHAASSSWPAGSAYGAGRDGFAVAAGAGLVTAAPLGLSCFPRTGPSALQVELGLLAKELALVQQYGGAARDLYSVQMPTAGAASGAGAGIGSDGGPPPTGQATGVVVGMGPGARGATPLPLLSAGTPALEPFRAAMSGPAAAAAAAAATAACGVWAGSLEALTRAQPLDITLQLVLPGMLAGVDASGARATALAVYNKVRRLASRVTGGFPAGHQVTARQRLHAPPALPTHLPAPTAAASSALNLLYEPLLSLAAGDTAGQQDGSQVSHTHAGTGTAAAPEPGDSGGGGAPLVLHCAYDFQACGGRERGMDGTWVALCWVDSTGQLLERRTVMLRPNTAAVGACSHQEQPPGLAGALSDVHAFMPQTVEHLVCSTVLHHSCALLHRLQASAPGGNGDEGQGRNAAQAEASAGAPILIISRVCRRLPAAEADAWSALLTPHSLQHAYAAAEQVVRAERGAMSHVSPPAPGTPGAPEAAALVVPRVLLTCVASHAGDEAVGVDPVHTTWPQGTVLMCSDAGDNRMEVLGGQQQAPTSSTPVGRAPPAAAVLSFPSPVSACALAAGAPCVQHWALAVEFDTQPGLPLLGHTEAHHHSGAEADQRPPVPLIAAVAQQLHGLTSLAAAYRLVHSGHATSPHGLSCPGASARAGPLAATRPVLPLHCNAAQQLLALCATAHVMLAG